MTDTKLPGSARLPAVSAAMMAAVIASTPEKSLTELTRPKPAAARAHTKKCRPRPRVLMQKASRKANRRKR